VHGDDDPTLQRSEAFPVSRRRPRSTGTSAALLLRSANEHHPHDLANSSGQVGRHNMVHNNSIKIGINPFRHNTSVFQKTL
jgi:hypothetical protein